jgi:hypothetical protein
VDENRLIHSVLQSVSQVGKAPSLCDLPLIATQYELLLSIQCHALRCQLIALYSQGL